MTITNGSYSTVGSGTFDQSLSPSNIYDFSKESLFEYSTDARTHFLQANRSFLAKISKARKYLR